jgi:hypothetical protein
VGTIETRGLEDELYPLYDTLNNPDRTPDGLVRPGAELHTPQKKGYSDADAPRELMAEAFRAYNTDPNWFKAVAPKTAARIREAINSNPDLRRFIQYNTLAGGAVLSGFGPGSEIPSQHDPDL